PGYGRASERSLSACLTAARTEALMLDPVYSGKALAGLAAHVAEGKLQHGQKAIFVHSGGGPGLFAQAEAIAAHLETI
ncbi:MAG: D-cysteine desulfhydrase family protein, partial [Pseudomonadota bacterium]